MSLGYDAALLSSEPAQAATGTGFLGGLSGVLSPVAAGLGLAGGLSGMFGETPEADYSYAAGQLYGGSFNPLVLGDKSNWILIGLIILAAVFSFRKK